MITQTNHIIPSPSGRSFLLDYHLPEDASNCPVVIFAHGFKGFKDWGFWYLVAEQFTEAGYVFVKFNFSHNGTTLEQPVDFADLEAFGQNNYTKELQDLDTVINWVSNHSNWPKADTVNSTEITLIGHSRGGGISIIKAASDRRIKTLITWASVARLDYSWYEKGEQIEKWQKAGVLRALNGRTKQMMPLYYQLFEDFAANKNAYSTELALQKREDLKLFFIHGTADPAVPYTAAEQLKRWAPKSKLLLMEGADHVFGGKHPWDKSELSSDGLLLCKYSIEFLKA